MSAYVAPQVMKLYFLIAYHNSVLTTSISCNVSKIYRDISRKSLALRPSKVSTRALVSHNFYIFTQRIPETQGGRWLPRTTVACVKSVTWLGSCMTSPVNHRCPSVDRSRRRLIAIFRRLLNRLGSWRSRHYSRRWPPHTLGRSPWLLSNASHFCRCLPVGVFIQRLSWVTWRRVKISKEPKGQS